MARFDEVRWDLGARQLRKQWAQAFSTQGLREDATAALSVALLAIPLSLAIALASDVPPGIALVSAVVAGGSFTLAGGAPANFVARWDGFAWNPLGIGTDDEVRALASFQNRLVAGGLFGAAGGSPASRIARWDGTVWAALGAGVLGYVLGYLRARKVSAEKVDAHG